MSRGLGQLEQFVLDRIDDAADEPLAAIAHRFSTLCIAVARLAAVAAGLVLMAMGGASGQATALCGGLAAGWVGISVRLELGSTPTLGRRRAGWTIALDIAMVTLGMALSGGGDSPVRLLLIALPLAVGLIVGPAAIGLGSLLLFAAYAALGPSTVSLAGIALQLAWAATLGAVIAAQRQTSLRRLARVDVLRRSVRAERRELRRADLAAELQETALEPLRGVAAEVGSATRAELASLSQAIVAVADRLRSIVVELHVLTARQGGLRSSLEGLALRRSPHARVAIAPVASDLGDAHLVQATALARAGLRAVAGPATEELQLEVEVERGTLRVGVRGVPGPPPEARRAETFAAQAAAAGATTAFVHGGVARAAVEQPERRRAPSWVPGRSLPDLRRLLVVARIGGVATALVGAALAGGAQPAFYVAAGLLLAWGPVVVWAAAGRGGSLRRWLLVQIPDVIGLVVMAATLGGATATLQTLLVAIAPCYGLYLSTSLTLTSSAVFLGGLAVAGATTPELLVGFTWGATVGAMLSFGSSIQDVLLARVSDERQSLATQLSAETQQERRALAEQLHDDTLQLLLAGRQDLEEAAAGDERARASGARMVDAAMQSLEAVAGGLTADADVLPDGPLHALEAIVTTVRERGGPHVSLSVAPEAVGHHDGLVVRLVGELVANAVTHAEASRVEVRVAREGDAIALDVVDDGRGLDVGRVRDALSRGHIGLASLREHVTMHGGRLRVDSGPRGGTRASARLPIAPSEETA